MDIKNGVFKKYMGSASKVVIPDGVTKIGKSAFYKSASSGRIIKNIIIPDSVTTIEENAFGNCKMLTSIKIPESVTEIKDNAFYGCTALKNIELPSNLTYLGQSLFYGCSSLTSIKIPESVTKIEDNAFYGCKSLGSVIILGSETYIGREAFSNCKKLKSIKFSEKLVNISEDAFSGTPIIEKHNGVRYVDNLVIDCDKELSHIEIREGTKAIKISAFYKSENLKSIKIPNSVVKIGWNAFEGTPLLKNQTGIKYADKWVVDCDDDIVSVEIKEGTKGITNHAFDRCSKLASITIPNSLTTIGDYAFDECISLENIKIPDSVTSIGDGAFASCQNLVSVDISKNITEIENRTFIDCISLANITLPNSITKIGRGAFEYCGDLISVAIPESVKSIDISAFFGCKNLKEINVSENNENYSSVDGVLFDKEKNKLLLYPNGKAEEKYIISDSVTTIGKFAFWGCKNIKDIVIPDSIMEIDQNAFVKCKSNIEIPANKRCVDTIFEEDTKIKLRIDDISIVIQLLDSYTYSKEEKNLAEFNFEKTEENFALLKKAEYKVPLALLMTLSSPEKASVFKAYTKRNIKKAVKYLIDNGDVENLVKLLPLGFVTAKNIDELVLYANEQKQTEMQIKLMNYKNEHIGYKDIEKQFKI